MGDEHTTWTVSTTAYMRNLDRDDLRSECVAVHYQSPPKKTEHGTSIGLMMPVLIVSLYSAEPREVADRVAAILNKHWDDPA
jgi:hypothetical protein